MAEKKPEVSIADIPDPDEDDLDDLDDVLDEFSAKLDISSKAASSIPSISGPGRPNTPPPAAAAASAAASAAGASSIEEDDFAKQLQAGMADLLGELENSPEMQKQFEQLLKEFGDASESGGADFGAGAGAGLAGSGGSGSGSGSSSKNTTTAAAAPSGSGSGSGSADATSETFQDTIRRTMERMQESGEQASAAAKKSDGEDLLAQLLGEMDGKSSDDDISKMIMGLMEELTNKEVLYEPMKELSDNFPAWLEKNRDKTDKTDLARYEEQASLVKEIVAKFEEPGYTDENSVYREYIVERMQKMQAAGSPPPDLVGDLNDAQAALGELDPGCNPQ